MQVRSPECVSVLKALEDDREQSVRTAAAAALGLLEQP
jgi:HEAT repeat protein